MDKAAETLDQNAGVRPPSTRPTPQIWDLVHSIVFYQRPQMNGVNKNLANVGSYGFAQPDYTKIGFMNARADRRPSSD